MMCLMYYSYAGLHCVVIKGYSKSAGYQPGVHFEDSRFRNSWNAVYVAGAWRFVQCNWGARHLVNAKEVPKVGAKGKSDSLRLETNNFIQCLWYLGGTDRLQHLPIQTNYLIVL